MDFEAFVKDITDNKWNVYGAEVYENGILTHSFGDTEGMYDLYSATKTITSIAVGIAYDEGKIDLDETILAYLPEDEVSKMSEDQYNTWKKISLRRLMTMSIADIPFVAEGDSWLDFALSCPINNPEERVFNYSNINTYLVGVCLTKAIGSDLGVFIEERIFKPLDIVNYEYARCPEGYFYGASRAKLSVHDLSKIGLLLYNGGEYNGKRIVSFNKTESQKLEADITATGDTTKIFLNCKTWMPKDFLEGNGDTRKLGILIRSIEVKMQGTKQKQILANKS